MRVGLIGFGAWGRRHAAAIAKTPGLALAAIASATDATRDAAAAAYPAARVTTDWRDVAADPAIDMLDVVAPNHLHAEIALAGLAASKHVLLEKPLALTAADCDRLLAAERASGRRISVGHELRLSVQWARVKREIDAGRIGAARHVALSLFRNPYRGGAGGWRVDPARVGSWMLEETVHFFDLALWYLAASGDPVSVRADAPLRDPATGLCQTVTTTLRFADGAVAVLNHSTGGFGHHLTLEVVGTEGAIRTTWQGVMDRDEAPAFNFRIRPKGFPFERGVNEFKDVALEPSGEVFELERQIELAAAAFARGEALVSAADARKSVLVCLAAEESARTTRDVALSL